MASSESLAVGLAVSIPSFLVLAFIALFWIRNYRKQKKEDSVENDIDLALRDDQAFSQFEQQLNQPADFKIDNISIKEKTVNSSSDSHSTHADYSSNTGSNSEIQTQGGRDDPPQTPTQYKNGSPVPSSPGTPLAQPRRLPHSKSNSVYDFYENFIPILPPSTPGKNPAQSTEPSIHDANNRSEVPSGNTSSASLGNGNSRSLDNLAKQLNNSGMFDKLPKVAPPSPFKVSVLQNNSSSDLINGLVQHDAINESYVYHNHDLAEPPTKKTPLDGAIENNFDVDSDSDQPVVFK